MQGDREGLLLRLEPDVGLAGPLLLIGDTSRNWLPFRLETASRTRMNSGSGITGSSSQETNPSERIPSRTAPKTVCSLVRIVTLPYSNSTVIFSIRIWPLLAWRTTLEAEPVHVTVRADLSQVAEAPPSRPAMSKQ